METDYTHEGKKLLLRALTAMVEHAEACAKGAVTGPWYDGEDFKNVYNALVLDKQESVKAVQDGMSEGFAKALLKAME